MCNVIKIYHILDKTVKNNYLFFLFKKNFKISFIIKPLNELVL